MHGFRGSAAILLALLMVGCVSGPSVIGGGESPTSSSAKDSRTTVRPQKPDAATPTPPPGTEMTGEFAVRVRAKVNGMAILDEELRSAVYPELLQIRDKPEPQKSALQKQILNQALDHLIDREIVLHEAFSKLKLSPQGQKVIEKLKGSAGKEFDKIVKGMKQRAHCSTDEELKQILLLQGQSLDAIRRQHERNFMMVEYMRYRVLGFTDHLGLNDVKEYYEQHPSEFQTVDSVEWQDIFVSAGKHGSLEEARCFAKDLVARLQCGDSFARLADKYDDGDSRFRGGQGLGQRHGDIKPPECEPWLFQAKPGQIGPLVELGTGVHVIRLAKREYAGLMPLDAKLQSFILNKLKNGVAEREWKRILKEMKSRAVMEIYP
jgi:parvulin-like peptidyl-prolyl isomerase